MPTADQCRARAADAERLAALVSYERDRVRLTRQAQEWRERAAALDAAPPPSEPAPSPALLQRVRRWLRPRTR